MNKVIKFTAEDLVKAMGLKIGDRIKFVHSGYELQIIEGNKLCDVKNDFVCDFASIVYLNREIEILGNDD